MLLPEKIGRYYKDLSPMIGSKIFAPDHEVHSYYTAAYIAYRLEFMFRTRRIEPDWKPLRFHLVMAARLILERLLKLDPKKWHSQVYCEKIDKVMAEPDEAQKIFGYGTSAISKAITALSAQGANRDRRTAKMRDMKDKLRAIIEEMTEAGTFPD